MPEIKKSSLVDQIYSRLRDEIISLQRPLGSKLNVNELQTTLQVSCTPIREAVNRLCQEGLVTYENNIGAHVLTLDANDVEEIQQLAMTLHCAAVRLAMQYADRQALAVELERRLQELRAARFPADEVEAVKQFVGTFYHFCGNHRLDVSMIAIQGQQLLLRHIFSVVHPADWTLDDFAGIVNAVHGGDTERVCCLLKHNAEAAQQYILDYVGRYGNMD